MSAAPAHHGVVIKSVEQQLGHLGTAAVIPLGSSSPGNREMDGESLKEDLSPSKM